MDAAFAAKRAALTVDLLVQNLSPHSNRGSEGAVTQALYKYGRYERIQKRFLVVQMDIQKKKLLRKQRDVFSAIVMSA